MFKTVMRWVRWFADPVGWWMILFHPIRTLRVLPQAIYLYGPNGTETKALERYRNGDETALLSSAERSPFDRKPGQP